MVESPRDAWVLDQFADLIWTNNEGPQCPDGVCGYSIKAKLQEIYEKYVAEPATAPLHIAIENARLFLKELPEAVEQALALMRNPPNVP